MYVCMYVALLTHHMLPGNIPSKIVGAEDSAAYIQYAEVKRVVLSFFLNVAK